MAIYNLTRKEAIWWQDLKQVKCPNSLKLKVVHPMKFMVTHIGRIASTLVIAVRIITILEKENISLMSKFWDNLKR